MPAPARRRAFYALCSLLLVCWPASLARRGSADFLAAHPGHHHLMQRKMAATETDETTSGNDCNADEAMASVHRATLGTPRLINTVCDNALFEGLVTRKKQIDSAIIDNIAIDLGLEKLDAQGKPVAGPARAVMPAPAAEPAPSPSSAPPCTR